MSKKEEYKKFLVDQLNEFIKTDNEEKIRKYLSSNSNLPGPRGNLELAYIFAEVIEDCSKRDPHKLWELASGLSRVSANEAPVNSPKEFLSFCGAVAAGAIGSVHREFRGKAFALLKKMAADSRWRTREGVAMGIQKLIAKQAENAFDELECWIKNSDWLTMRAVAAGVAEPALLKDMETAKAALDLHRKIIAQVLAAKERKSDEFKTLRQALGYSLSVVICAIPEEGFEYLRNLIDSRDTDVSWVIKENLKKNRLTKNFPTEVAETKKSL